MLRRTTTVAIVALTLALAGCNSGTPDTTGDAAPKTTAPASPKEALIAAAPAASGKSYAVAAKSAPAAALRGTASGRVDPAAKGNDLLLGYTDKDLGFTMNLQYLFVGEEAWVKITFAHTEGLTGLPSLPKKWLHLDKSKLDQTDGAVGYDPDPMATTKVLNSAVAVTETAPGKYAGTVDISGVSGDSPVIDEDELKALGAKAKAVPFTATVDSEGHLATLTVSVPAAGSLKAYTYTETYSAYGTAEPVKAPAAGEAQEAPAAAYELLNG